jgi:flagellar biosynthetic protein FlhB
MSVLDDQKSIEPTAHRREMARRDGRVPRSVDFTSAGLLLGGLMALVVSGGALLEFLAGLMTQSLGGHSWRHLLHSNAPSGVHAVAEQWQPLAVSLGRVVLPPLVLVALLAIALNVVQTGFLFLPGKLAPDAGRVNPLAGLRRVFAPGNVVRLMLGVCKLAAVLAVAFASVYEHRAELVALGTHDVPQVMAVVWDLCWWTCLKVGSALLILAALDYAFQRWQHERDLRMTPEELREEMRNLQGDPQLAARRRQARGQLAGVARVGAAANPLARSGDAR